MGFFASREENVSAGSAQSAHTRAPQGGGRTPCAAVMDLSELDASSGAERSSSSTPQGYSITGLLMTAAGGTQCASVPDSLLSASLLSAFAAAPTASVVQQPKFTGRFYSTFFTFRCTHFELKKQRLLQFMTINFYCFLKRG